MHQLIPAAPTASAGYAAISPDEVAAKIRFRARSVSNPLQLGAPRRGPPVMQDPTLGCIGQLAVTGRLMAVGASKARQAEASTHWTDWEPASGQRQASGQVCRIQRPDR